MQLAAPQRAHPPPVPPRPSRQVVAEALKKSPRPPCPTRQAPPPPNQRPWRLEEQQRPRESGGGGRTIVYDSAHLVRAASGIGGKLSAEERRRPAPRDLSKVGQVPQVAGRTPNGTTGHRREPCIDDTSRRKDESSDSSKARKSDCENVDRVRDVEPNDRDGLRVEIKEASGTDGSAERKRRKPHCVTFKEEERIPVLVNGESRGGALEGCATVVVIDEVEGARAASQEEHDNIQRQDWLEAGVRYSSTKITLPAEEVVVVNGFARQDQEQQRQQQRTHAEKLEESAVVEGDLENQLEFGDLDFSSIIERIAMSSLQGLPPLPRSLSGFNLNGAGLIVEPPPPPPARSSSRSQRTPKTPTPTSTTSLSSQGSRPSPQGRQLTTLDTQLAILRREMFGLRQLDLSLLSQLWSLNESIQEFRQLLQEQEDRAPSPSPSSEEGDDTSYSGSNQPPPPPRRPGLTTPHHHQHHHHHRSTRSLRNSKLSPSDESPSSEEYGAV